MTPTQRFTQMFKALARRRGRRDESASRHFALAVRADGASVHAVNSRIEERAWQPHAEARLCRKVDVNAVVYVLREAKGEWANSRPCENCQRLMKRKGVKRVYYTIGPSEYGVLTL